MAEIPADPSGEQPKDLQRHQEMMLIQEALRLRAAHIATPDTKPVDMSAQILKPSFEAHPALEGPRHKARRKNRFS